jgi:predicted esterase
MLQSILTAGALLFALSTHPQMTPATRYKDAIFSSITVQRDLSYASGKSHRFDWYEPREDTTTARPLIIWMHGGGFKFGSKNMQGIRLWSDFFARRGYECAAIDYQLGKKNLRFKYDDLVRNCVQAVGDCREAIAWFKRNAARLRIDTSRIILAGNSAGGMIALQTAYGVEPGGAAAVINFWGGIFDTRWLQRARVPIVSVHGRNDNIVPYDHKGYPLYGSGAIHPIADSLHIPNRLKTYEGYSHELQKHFNPLIVSRLTKRRWLEAAQFAADFLYEELFNR